MRTLICLCLFVCFAAQANDPNDDAHQDAIEMNAHFLPKRLGGNL